MNQHGLGRSFAALLFDMDGTLITSIEAAERVWTRWAAQHGLDARAFLPQIHGKRAVDTIRSLRIPGADPVAEAERLTLMEIEDTDGVREIPGAAAFLGALPRDRWAVVTSAPRALATRRLAAAGLNLPAVLVCADDVRVGKPDPSGYRLAAQRLGVEAADCAIFEDADAGIRAGEAAGGQVIVITATHAHALESAHPAFPDFLAVEPRVDAGRIRIEQRR
ncbi:MAG TPA: HAD-IA family hydrolase [Steroidobacteraceae bacterium]|nr:HAD-IA family hydrolase [Steroidobacteraceae bacterium]